MEFAFLILIDRESAQTLILNFDLSLMAFLSPVNFFLFIINESKFMSEQLLLAAGERTRPQHGFEINTEQRAREYDKLSTLSWVVTDLKLGSLRLDVNFIYM